MPSNPIRASASLFSLAQREGALMSRSAAQQIEHWARLGAAVEVAGVWRQRVCRFGSSRTCMRGRTGWAPRY
jgi:hypothetical protein